MRKKEMVSNLVSLPSGSVAHDPKAPTPTISNCASPKLAPPPLSLAGGPCGRTRVPRSFNSAKNSVTTIPPPQDSTSSLNSMTSQEAKFSSPTATPIVVQRPLVRNLSPATLSPIPPTTPIQRRESTHVEKKKRSAVWIHHSFSLSLSMDGALDSTLVAMMDTESPSSFFKDTATVYMWSSILWQVVPVWLACDLIKTDTPWKLLQQCFLRLWQTIPWRMPPPTQIGLSSVATSRAKRPHMSSPSQPRVVQGIPNYGQTCFLNAVLQSLASLEPFLVYLKRLQQVQHDTHLLDMDNATPSENKKEDFAEHLGKLLLRANGVDPVPQREGSSSRRHRESWSFSNQISHNRVVIDPRPLLQRISESNSQFSNLLGEQQDAQELLQALLGVVISEARLDTLSSSADHFRFSIPDDLSVACSHQGGRDLESDEPLTAVMADVLDETNLRQEKGVELEFPIAAAVDTDGALSLSSLLERIDQRKLQQPPKSTTNDKPTTAGATISTYFSSATEPRSQNADVPGLSEEKKQEDFELTDPLAASEEDLVCFSQEKKESHPSLYTPNIVQTQRPDDYMSSRMIPFSLSASKYGEKVQPCFVSHSTSMQIVRSTISSITPSPLSGWLGSTLQCSKCQHVRPIQNSPFLDIPLIPSSVPAYLARARHPSHRNGASPSSSTMPACSLEQCLADFTSVERVQDVECRVCTIQTKVSELQDEELMLKGAILSTEKRIRAKGGNALEETSILKEELTNLQLRLVKLQTMDPDDEDSMMVLGDEIKEIDDDGFVLEPSKPTTPTRVERCPALKCLFLTRCPSILCCHIQRRYYDPYLDRMDKCVQFLQFDEILDLSPYCAYSSETSTSWAAGSSTATREGGDVPLSKGHNGHKILYRLQSVIEHRGSAHGGHYLSYRRLGSSWFRISDNRVSPITWGQVRLCQAYMLFYEAI